MTNQNIPNRIAAELQGKTLVQCQNCKKIETREPQTFWSKKRKGELGYMICDNCGDGTVLKSGIKL